MTSRFRKNISGRVKKAQKLRFLINYRHQKILDCSHISSDAEILHLEVVCRRFFCSRLDFHNTTLQSNSDSMTQKQFSLESLNLSILAQFPRLPCKQLFLFIKLKNINFVLLRCALDSRILFLAQIRNDIRKVQQQLENQSIMHFWCFNCSKITFPKAGMKCQYCASEAIEETRDENNPAQYIPYNLPAQPNPPQAHPQDQTERSVFRISLVSPMGIIMPPFLPMAPVTFIRVFTMSNQEEQSAPVDDERYEKLEKIGALESDCAVCQQRAGSGVKLGCRHEFHEDCIKPWFKNANTCPCCRATV